VNFGEQLRSHRNLLPRGSNDHSPGAPDEVANVVACLAHCVANQSTMTEPLRI
jgi:hypothetical protein